MLRRRLLGRRVRFREDERVVDGWMVDTLKKIIVYITELLYSLIPILCSILILIVIIFHHHSQSLFIGASML